MVIEWTEPALTDLDNFKLISKKVNVSEYIRKLFKYSHQLAGNPELGRPYRYLKNKLIRKLVYKEHSIFYIIDEKIDTIYILSVVHYKQNVNKSLKIISKLINKE